MSDNESASTDSTDIDDEPRVQQPNNASFLSRNMTNRILKDAELRHLRATHADRTMMGRVRRIANVLLDRAKAAATAGGFPLRRILRPTFQYGGYTWEQPVIPFQEDNIHYQQSPTVPARRERTVHTTLRVMSKPPCTAIRELIEMVDSFTDEYFYPLRSSADTAAVSEYLDGVAEWREEKWDSLEEALQDVVDKIRTWGSWRNGTNSTLLDELQPYIGSAMYRIANPRGSLNPEAARTNYLAVLWSYPTGELGDESKDKAQEIRDAWNKWVRTWEIPLENFCKLPSIIPSELVQWVDSNLPDEDFDDAHE